MERSCRRCGTKIEHGCIQADRGDERIHAIAAGHGGLDALAVAGRRDGCSGVTVQEQRNTEGVRAEANPSAREEKDEAGHQNGYKDGEVGTG